MIDCETISPINFDISMYIVVCNEAVPKLKFLNENDIRKHHSKYQIIKRSGFAFTSVGFGMITTGSFALLPTAGMSIIVGSVGAVLSGFGGIVFYLNDLLNEKFIYKLKLKIESILNPRLEIAIELKKYFEFIEVYLLNDFSINKSKIIKDGLQNSLKIVKAIEEISFALKAITVVAKVSGYGIAFRSIIGAVTLIDVYETIKSWNKPHPLSDELNDIIKKIELSVKVCEAMNKLIQINEEKSDLFEALFSLAFDNVDTICTKYDYHEVIDSTIFNEKNKYFKNKNNEQSIGRFYEFNERMYKLIHKYLSIEDKMRFSCVSKQWKACIYKTQSSIHLTNNKISNESYELSIFKMRKYFGQNEEVLISVIENLFDKFTFVKTIRVGDKIQDGLLIAIINKCNNLRSIKFNVENYGKETIKIIGEKCGKNLSYVEFCDLFIKNNEKRQALLKLCPNLTKIKCQDINELISSYKKDYPKLREVRVTSSCDNKGAMDLFVNRYSNSLIAFETTLDDNNIKNQNLQLYMICNLTQLKILKLSFMNTEIFSLLNKIASLGENSKEINVLEIKHLIYGQNADIIKYYDSTINLNKLLYIAKSFKQLTKLSIFIPFTDSNNDVSLCSISKCKNLTIINFRATITDTIFDKIDKYLPKLKVIKIETNKSLSNKAMNSLSKLNHLKSLKIKMENAVSLITETGIKELAENCVRLQSLTLNPITHFDVSKLIDIAILKYEVNFKYYTFGKYYCPEIFDNITISEIIDFSYSDKLI